MATAMTTMTNLPQQPGPQEHGGQLVDCPLIGHRKMSPGSELHKREGTNTCYSVQTILTVTARTFIQAEVKRI